MPLQTQERFDPKRSINYNLGKARATPPAAGKGRRPGTKNVVTASLREMIHKFVVRNIDDAQTLYNKVAQKDPGKALQILTNLCDFALPRLQRTEMAVTGSPLVSATPITDAAEAAATYAAVLGNTSIDLTLVRFSGPRELPALPDNVVAVQDPDDILR